MADFCDLCGYGDFNVHEIYDEHVKPLIKEKKLDILKDGELITMGGWFVCESCGILSVVFDKKYNAFGIYLNDDNETDKIKIGYIDKTSFDFIFDEEHPLYKEQRESAKAESEAMMKEYKIYQKKVKDIAYKLYCDEEKDVVSYEEFDIKDEKNKKYREEGLDIYCENEYGDSK